MGSFWAITCYFNPCSYQNRLLNYKIFSKFLKVPLITVELSYNDSFELTQEDADILIQIKGKDVMWQKERLLNVALEHLPDDCEKFAWLDCDVIFYENELVNQAIFLLDKFNLIHLFKNRYDWHFYFT